LPLAIAYCNVRGLDENAFNDCISSLHTNTFQLHCLSETWFMRMDQYRSHSFFLSDSLFPTNPHLNRRQDGGLLLFASPSIKDCCKITHRSRYSLVVDINTSGKRICFVYYPPSLDDTIISKDLQDIGKIDILMGDINVRLGKLSGDTTTTAQSRKSTIYSHLASSSLDYTRNSNNSVCSRTDHIFTSLPSVEWEYKTNLPFDTDHGRMEVNTTITYLSKKGNIGSRRFDFKPLHNPAFQSDFINRFNISYSHLLLSACNRALDTCCHSMILPNTMICQQIIDDTYDLMIDLIKILLNETLTTYDAHEVKSKPDSLLLHASVNSLPTFSTIRAFKRSQRNLSAQRPILSDNPLKSPLTECTEYYQSQFDSTTSPPSITRQNDIEFGLLFTDPKIREALLKYPLHKSIGPDGIHTLVFRLLSNSDKFLSSLSALFHLFASTSLVPSSWSTCNLHLLIKNQALPRTASNTRPIALSNILRRVFEKLVLRNWMELNNTANASDITSWMNLDSGQAGFRRGYSTISHIILSDEISRRNNPFSIFLDIKGAFDNVNWSKLNELLIARNCPPSHRNLILSLMCRPAELLLSVNQSERLAIKTKKGVFQGGGISAFIFSIYIDPLAQTLNANTPIHRPLGLLYADDIQIKPRNEEAGQMALDLCTQYGNQYDMQWSISKCAIVGNCEKELILSGSVLPVAAEYKYLGVIHRKSGVDFKTTYENALTKQNRLMAALSNKPWHPQIRLTVYRTFIRPISEYVSALTYIWANQDLKSRHSTIKLMENAHKTAIQWIFNKKQHLRLLDFISGLGPFTYRMECLRAGLARALSKLSSSNPLVSAKSVYFLSNSKNYLLHECFRSKYWKSFKDANKDPHKKVTWVTHMKHQFKCLQKEAARTSATIAYYSPTLCTSRISQVFYQPLSNFQTILAWRLNRSLLHRTCLCFASFTRAHVNCILMNHPLYMEITNSLRFKVQSNKLAINPRAAHFTPLDHLLNLGKFDDFIYLFNLLKNYLDLPSAF
jgi:hypothetical protein